MYLTKLSTQLTLPAPVEETKSDLERLRDTAIAALPKDPMKRALLAAPLIYGAYTQRDNHPLLGVVKGTGATAGGYLGYHGGKMLSDKLEERGLYSTLSPEKAKLAKLITALAGTAIGAKLGWNTASSMVD